MYAKTSSKKNSESAILKRTVSNLGELPADNQMSYDPTTYGLKLIYTGFFKSKTYSVFESFILLNLVLSSIFG